jgi:hypothetical protein
MHIMSKCGSETVAKVGNLDAQLARLQEQIRKAKEASRVVTRRKRAVLRDNEKRRVWVVGTCAMAAMRDARVRDLIARELAKDGVLRKEGDAELFADLLAGTYVPTREEDKARREMDGPANGGGAEAAPLAAG